MVTLERHPEDAEHNRLPERVARHHNRSATDRDGREGGNLQNRHCSLRSSVEMMWENPLLARFLRRLASFSRLIVFDKRGTGLSDRVPELPTLEQRMDDVRAVMDAVGSARAALFGHSEGASMCILFAATYPKRTIALATYGAFAKRLRSDDYPWAPTLDERLRGAEELERSWGDPKIADLAYYAPSIADDVNFQEWLDTYFRRSASPKAAADLLRMNSYTDVRAVLPSVHVFKHN